MSAERMPHSEVMKHIATFDPVVGDAVIQLILSMQAIQAEHGYQAEQMIEWAIGKLVHSNASAMGCSVKEATKGVLSAIAAHEAFAQLGIGDLVTINAAHSPPVNKVERQ